jgi:hypothetical protein
VNKSTLSRWAPLTGVISVVLIVLAGSLGSIFDYLPSPDRVVAELTGKGVQGQAAVFLGYFSALFMFFFAGSLWSAFSEREGDQGWLSLAASAGGISAGVVLLISFSILEASLSRAGTGGGISVDGAVTLQDIWGSLMGGALPFSLGVLVGAAGAMTIRTNLLPGWFGWLGLLAALISISPIGYIGQLAAMVWIAVVSPWLVVRGSATMQPVSPSASESTLPS